MWRGQKPHTSANNADKIPLSARNLWKKLFGKAPWVLNVREVAKATHCRIIGYRLTYTCRHAQEREINLAPHSPRVSVDDFGNGAEEGRKDTVTEPVAMCIMKHSVQLLLGRLR